MVGCLPNWKMEDDSKPFHGQDNELIELLRRNRHANLHRQTNRNAPPESLLKCGESIVNSSNFIAEEVTAPWFQFPSDNLIEREFSEFFYGIPTAESMYTDKSLKEDANICAKKSSFHPYENVILPPRSNFYDSAAIETFTKLGKLGKAGLVSEKRNLCEEASSTESVVAMGASSSMGKLLSGVCGSNEAQKISSSSGGSRRSTTNHGLKRRRRDAEESEGYSEEAEDESAEANKSAQRPESGRRSRSAEVHNLSERRRRDKINEKMRALQELIPHCNKSDKASMLDEAIEYLKSLQLQLQIMWMGNGMAPMLFPSIQQYLPGTDIGMNHHLPRAPPSDVQSIVTGTSIPNQPPAYPLEAPNSINFATQLHNFHLPGRYLSYFGFPQMQMSPQVMNMCTYGAQMMEQNQMVAVVEKQQHANNKSSI